MLLGILISMTMVVLSGLAWLSLISAVRHLNTWSEEVQGWQVRFETPKAGAKIPG